MNGVGRRVAAAGGCVVIGGSSGSFSTLPRVLGRLAAGFILPVVVVQHQSPETRTELFIEYLSGRCALPVREVEEKEAPAAGVVYLAPPNYHLLIETDRTVALSVDDRLYYCRPAIDPLFESAAVAYGPACIGVVLTGANQDGAAGLAAIRRRGGLAVVQDPAGAESAVMPRAAIAAADPEYVLAPEEIGDLLCRCGDAATPLARERKARPAAAREEQP